MKEEQIFVKPIAEKLSSIAGYSGTIYIITLTLSICYNIGYLKQINPQIIDLIELSDYINDTIHNIWFFLIGALVFFIGSLDSVKAKAEEEFNKILLFGIFAFIISVHYLLKGIYDSKFWPMMKKLLDEDYDPSLTLYLYLVIMIVGIVAIYCLMAAKIVNNGKKNAVSASIAPILIFFTLVLMPYIGGMSQGYIENKYLTKEDYQAAHPVNIRLASGDEILKDVYIVKELSKGLVIRQFNHGEENDTFRFVNWAYIKSVTYKRVEKLLSPT